jgi:hypothetical protein
MMKIKQIMDSVIIANNLRINFYWPHVITIHQRWDLQCLLPTALRMSKFTIVRIQISSNIGFINIFIVDIGNRTSLNYLVQ